MLKELKEDRKPINTNELIKNYEQFAIKYWSCDKQNIVLMECRHSLPSGTMIYVAYYEDGEVDIMCVEENDTFAERFNFYLTHSDGEVWGCNIDSVNCNVEYRLW